MNPTSERSERGFLTAPITVLLVGAILLACSSGGPGELGDGGTSDARASSDGGSASCDELAKKAADALDKQCTVNADCGLTVQYGCCAIPTGIRADKKGSFEAARDAHATACPDRRGCGCAGDQTETNETVPPGKMAVVTCDNGKCTAHAPP